MALPAVREKKEKKKKRKPPTTGAHLIGKTLTLQPPSNTCSRVARLAYASVGRGYCLQTFCFPNVFTIR